MKDLFGDDLIRKSYRALRHDVVRTKQKKGSQEVHHQEAKRGQVLRVLDGSNNLDILELFCGDFNLTELYSNYSRHIRAYDKKERGLKAQYKLKIDYTWGVDSFTEIHKEVGDGLKYDVVDADPYGFPLRLFPHIFLLIDNGYLFLTFPKPHVNILNGITQTLLTSYIGKPSPKRNDILDYIATEGLKHWRKIELIDEMEFRGVWRWCFKVQSIKATEYTGVKNR